MDTKAVASKAKKLAIRGAIAVVLLGAVGTALYIFSALEFSYSEGERVGFVQKLSKRGWVCKTNEGELAMLNIVGQNAQIFPFTVREDVVARQIEALDGHKVALQYKEHRGIPSTCFGETNYYVIGVKKAD
jgi:hypothetical protein